MAQLVREILIDASPETIFELLTDAEKHVQWNGTEAELDARTGGVYRVLVAGEHAAAGEFVEVVPNERVVLAFGWDEPNHPIPAGSTRVVYELVPDGTKTLVRLTHSGLPDDAISDHTEGWDHYLDRLNVVATGGDPGPDIPDPGAD